MSLIRQKIGLLIKFWLVYGVFWAYQHLSRLFFVTLPSNNSNLITAFKVDVKVSQSYTNENGGKTGGKVGGDVPSLSQALSQVLSPDEERDASIDAKDATSSSKVATLDEEAANLADNGRNSVIRKQRQELHKELQW